MDGGTELTAQLLRFTVLSRVLCNTVEEFLATFRVANLKKSDSVTTPCVITRRHEGTKQSLNMRAGMGPEHTMQNPHK